MTQLTKAELAKALRVTTRTVERWSARGWLPTPVRLPNGRLRFPLDQVKDALRGYGIEIPDDPVTTK